MGVFVTDGNQRSTLAVVRALGRAGVAVTVGEDETNSLAGSSRHCASTKCYPSPLRHPQAFMEFIRREMSGGKYRVLLPMTDITLQLIASDKEYLDELVCLPIPSANRVRRAQDKGEVLLLAQKLGIPCPLTCTSDEESSLLEFAQQAGYPVVIKPRWSFFRRQHWATGIVQYASSPEDLMAKYRQADAQIPKPLIQERIVGEGRGVFLLVWNGELKGAFCHRRLREKPPWGGVSVYRESINRDDELVRKSFDLLKALEWQGVAMIEFKLDQRDGKTKLIEVNGRFWGSLQLAVDAGINFPLLLYRLAIGEQVQGTGEYRAGVKSRWLLGDLDQLLIRLTRSRGINGDCRWVESPLRACASFLKFYERDLHYEVFRLEDPNPGWFECKSYLRQLISASRLRKEEHCAH